MKNKKLFSDYWFKYYCDHEITLCTLCGNTGYIETSPKSPIGKQLKTYKNYCICPNGRTMRGE